MGQYMNIELCYNKTMFKCIRCSKEFVGQPHNANKYCSYGCYHETRWPKAQRKFKKIDGIWYKDKCADCGSLKRSQYSEKCHSCRWKDERNPPKGVEHYHAAHWWVKKHYGKPGVCDKCGFTDQNTRRFHWANLSGKYLRDRSDWARLCVRCHVGLDRKGVRL